MTSKRKLQITPIAVREKGKNIPPQELAAARKVHK
jgi:hypothetical protein